MNNFFIVFVMSLPTKLEIYYLQYNYLHDLWWFCQFFVANLLNRPTDGPTVSVRKRVTFRPPVSR
jgi:hypothetical protein